MAAVVSEATRHVMQANRSCNTKPELIVRAALRDVGLAGYRLHWRKAPGRPDVCYPGRKVAIFVNGCYWHRCPRCARPLPKTNTEFWASKFERNRERDQRTSMQLMSLGWTVVVIWECQLKGGRLERVMRGVERVVRLSEDERMLGGRMIEVTAFRSWRLARARQRLSRR